MDKKDQTPYELEEIIQLSPKDAAGYINKRNNYWLQDEYDKAIADYSKAIRLDPNSVLLQEIMGMFIYAIGHIDSGT